jgi:hypothetical protein
MGQSPDDAALPANASPQQQTAIANYLSAYEALLATQVGPDGPSPELVAYEAALEGLNTTLGLGPAKPAPRFPTAPPPVTSALSSPQARPSGLSSQPMKNLVEFQASFNLQYLQLQEKIQQDNRQFNLVSNIMKTKHDAAKNALNNIK